MAPWSSTSMVGHLYLKRLQFCWRLTSSCSKSPRRYGGKISPLISEWDSTCTASPPYERRRARAVLALRCSDEGDLFKAAVTRVIGRIRSSETQTATAISAYSANYISTALRSRIPRTDFVGTKMSNPSLTSFASIWMRTADRCCGRRRDILTLRDENGRQLATQVPVIAVWVPARLGAAWIVQDDDA